LRNPSFILAALSKQIGETLADPAMQARFANLGAEPVPKT
jgi:hypothetical protein